MPPMVRSSSATGDGSGLAFGEVGRREVRATRQHHEGGNLVAKPQHRGPQIFVAPAIFEAVAIQARLLAGAWFGPYFLR